MSPGISKHKCLSSWRFQYINNCYTGSNMLNLVIIAFANNCFGWKCVASCRSTIFLFLYMYWRGRFSQNRYVECIEYITNTALADAVLCLQPLLWGRSRDELHHRIFSQQPIKDWEGQPPHMYGEIIYSSLVSLYDSYTQVSWESAGSGGMWLHQGSTLMTHILLILFHSQLMDLYGNWRLWITDFTDHFCWSIFVSLLTYFCWSLQGMHEHFLVLFSSHLLILSLDHSQQDFIYKVHFVHFTLKRQMLWIVK